MNRWPWLAAFCLAVLGLGAVCARVEVPRPVSPPASPPSVALPLYALPPVSLPPPAAGRPAGLSSVEAARVKAPAWARLEEVWGTTDNLRHPGMTAGAFTADGQTLVTLDHRGHLRVWDLTTRVLRAELDACVVAPRDNPWPGAHALVISPDGLAALGFRAGRICVADLATGKLIRIIEAHAAHVVGLAFAGGLLVSYGYQPFVGEETPVGYIAEQEQAGGEVRWWNPRTGARVAEVVVGPQQAIGFFPDGNQLVTVGKELAVWQRDGAKTWHHPATHTATVAALAVLPDDQLLVAPRDGGLAVLSAETGQSGAMFQTAAGRIEKYGALAVTAGGRLAATVTDDGVSLVLWDLHTQREIGRRATSAVHRRVDPGELAFSPDGSRLVTNIDGPAVWSVRPLEPVWSSVPGALTGATLSHDGRLVLTCVGGVARLWELATGRTIVGWKLLGNHEGALLMPDGKRFLDENQMRDVQTGAVLWSIGPRDPPMGSALASPDGRRIAPRGYGLFWGTQLHDSANGNFLLWQRPDSEPLAFSADGRTLYVRTGDWHVLGLDATNGTVRSQIDRHRTDTTAFYPSPDRKRALAVDYRELTGYDLASGQPIWHAKLEGGYDLPILPDSSAFVSCGQTIRLRSMANGLDLGPPLPLDGILGGAGRCIVSPDGKTLLVGSGEGLVYRFALDSLAR